MALTTVAKVKDYIGIASADDDALLSVLVDRATDLIQTYCDRKFESATYASERYNGRGFSRLYLKQWPLTAVARVAVGEQSALEVTSSDGSAYSATVEVSDTAVLTALHGGTNDGTNTDLIASYTSLSAMATQIATHTSWTASVVSGYDNWESTELIRHGARETNDTSLFLEVPNDRMTDFDVDYDDGVIYRSGGFARGERNVYVNYTAGYTTIPDDLDHTAIEVVADLFKMRSLNTSLKSERIGDYGYTNFDNQSQQSVIMNKADDLHRYRRLTYA